MILFTTHNVISPIAAFIMALNAGFSVPHAKQAVCVTQYESAFRINAQNTSNKNGTVDHGLTQINDIWATGLCRDLNLYDPHENFKCARRVFEVNKQSFKPWIAYRKHEKICTENYAIKTCPAPKITNKTDLPITSIPPAIVISATRVCRDKYHGCLKELIRTSKRAFKAVCGGA